MLFRFKDELNLQKSYLIFRRIKDENSCPSYVTKLFTKNSGRYNRTSRYGRYNSVSPSYNRETEGGRSVEPNSGAAFLLIFARNSLFALLNFLFENIFYLEILSLIR